MPSSDIFPQRVSVFVQRRTRDIRREPVTEAEKAKHANKKLDNGNAILLFDNANSLNAKDTLIPARSEVENEWRKMPFRYDQSCDGWGDDKVVLSAMKSIMNFLFYNAVDVWDDLLDKSWEHYTILVSYPDEQSCCRLLTCHRRIKSMISPLTRAELQTSGTHLLYGSNTTSFCGFIRNASLMPESTCQPSLRASLQTFYHSRILRGTSTA